MKPACRWPSVCGIALKKVTTPHLQSLPVLFQSTYKQLFDYKATIQTTDCFSSCWNYCRFSLIPDIYIYIHIHMHICVYIYTHTHIFHLTLTVKRTWCSDKLFWKTECKILEGSSMIRSHTETEQLKSLQHSCLLTVIIYSSWMLTAVIDYNWMLTILCESVSLYFHLLPTAKSIQRFQK